MPFKIFRSKKPTPGERIIANPGNPGDHQSLKVPIIRLSATDNTDEQAVVSQMAVQSRATTVKRSGTSTVQQATETHPDMPSTAAEEGNYEPMEPMLNIFVGPRNLSSPYFTQKFVRAPASNMPVIAISSRDRVSLRQPQTRTTE